MEDIASLEQKLQQCSGPQRVPLLNDLASRLLATSPERAVAVAEESYALCEHLYTPLQPTGSASRRTRGAQRTGLHHMAQTLLTLATVRLRTGAPGQAAPLLNTCIAYADDLGDTGLRIRAINPLALLHALHDGDVQQAETLLLDALALARRSGDDKGAAITEANLGRILVGTGRYDDALPYLQSAVDGFRRLGLGEGESDVLHQLGQVYCQRGETAQALRLLLQSLYIRESLQFTRETAVSLMGIGNVYDALGEYTEALRYQLKSLALFEQLEDTTGAADVLSNIGNIYRQTDDIRTALDYYGRSLNIRKQTGNTTGQATLLNNIGTAYARLGDYEQSIDYLQRSLALCEQYGDQHGSAVAMVNIGITYNERRRFAGAREYINGALAIFRNRGSKQDEAAALLALGKINIDSGEAATAVGRLEEALGIAGAIGARYLMSQIHECLAQAWEQCGDTARALRHYREFHTLREHLFNDHSDRRRQALHIHYEVERSQKEAEVQRLKRERLERDVELKNRELTATTMLLAQKNDLLRELYAQVREIRELPDAQRTTRLRSLLASLEDHLTSRQTWEAFEQHFTRIHGTFHSALLERCPTLSPAEMKVCALIRLTLSMKEIATLLAVTVMTVKKHRYNIRKKLGLKDGENLTRLLASL